MLHPILPQPVVDLHSRKQVAVVRVLRLLPIPPAQPADPLADVHVSIVCAFLADAVSPVVVPFPVVYLPNRVGSRYGSRYV